MMQMNSACTGSRIVNDLRNWNVHVLLYNPLQRGKGYDRRHFHQLFRQLRVANSGLHGDIIGQDLGHFDNLLGIRRELVEEMHDVRQLFHHLRHRIVESRQRRDSIDNPLHGAPQNPLLRPGQGRKPVRPRPARLFFVEAEEHRLGSGVVPDRRREAHLTFQSLALAILGRCALWCNFSPRAIATVIRSCLSHERSRCCRRLIAALSPCSQRLPASHFHV